MYSSYYEERELGWNDGDYHDSTRVVSTIEIDGIPVKVGQNSNGCEYFSSGRNWWDTPDQAVAEFRKEQAERESVIAIERSAMSHTNVCGEAVKALDLDIKVYVYNKDFVSVWSENKKTSREFQTRNLTPQEVAEQVLLWETTETKEEKVAALRKAGKPIPKHLR